MIQERKYELQDDGRVWSETWIKREKRLVSITFKPSKDARALVKIMKEKCELCPTIPLFTNLLRYPDSRKEAKSDTLSNIISTMFLLTRELVSVQHFKCLCASYLNSDDRKMKQ